MNSTDHRSIYHHLNCLYSFQKTHINYEKYYFPKINFLCYSDIFFCAGFRLWNLETL